MNLKRLNRVLLQLLLLPMLGVSVLAGVFVWQIVNAVHTVDRIQLADDGTALTTQIISHVIDEIAGLRGYQLTGNAKLLQTYRAGEAPLGEEFRELRTDVAKEGGNVESVDHMVATYTSWEVSSVDPLLGIQPPPSQRRYLSTLTPKEQLLHMRDELSAITGQQHGIRDHAATRFRLMVRRTIELAIGLALAVGLLIGVFSRAQLGSVSGAFGKTMDALRANGREIHASEQRLRTILASIGEGVLVCGGDGCIELLNDVAQSLTGWAEAEAMRQPVLDVLRLVSDDRARTPAPLPVTEILSGMRSFTALGDALLLRRDGTTLAVEASAAPVSRSDGTVRGAVIVFRDMTEKRRTQAALLASEKLAVAGRLAATIAHEIHNPLDATINLVDLLRQEPTEAERGQFLSMAAGELDRVARISRAMLGMYRESKTPVPVEMGELLQSLLLLLERNLAQQQVAVRAELAEPAMVRGYPAELRQVFTNLLTNALDASAAGGTITVRLTRTEDGVCVMVRDQGEGIPQEITDRLFQPFFTTTGERGTELGLWVSQGLVEKHGGTMRVETRTEGPEHGTDMIVMLPA